jgi:hypothetical protein
MSYLELWGLIGQIGLVLLVLGGLGWLCRRRRRPYRDGRRESMPVDSSPVDPATPPHSQTVITETQTQFIGVPCDSGLDLSRIADALNRQDTSVTDHRDQDDDHPGPSWGIIR